ncbi:N-acetylmuramoyl-L-alanine amidase [Desulfovibrio sp. OttesenSCG-928-G15]|nr:N-acetylmuramoyl-L-alanine amidase [Desulfovibrio sp. OttesenSCG-928-G15]
MRTISEIIIHCSATPPTLDIGAKEIRGWHTASPPRGNGWADIGYHGVIRRNGILETGRMLDRAGAHCSGHNAHSVGICLVGGINALGRPENNFTPEQWGTLARTVQDLVRKFPKAKVFGHNEFSTKACPSFNVRAWWSAARQNNAATGGAQPCVS